MIISKLKFKNLKSYGEVMQVIEFTNDGKLILLAGNNGSGKSTIKDAIDLALYNKVSGKRKKTLPLTQLKNRINHQGTPLSIIEFINNLGNNISISRYIPNSKTKIFVDKINKSEEFKKYTDEQKDNLIGFNYETFKSFISLSMNDFKNFITLKPSEKNQLINKLYNLEMLDSLCSIISDELKEIDKQLEYTYSQYNENEKLKEVTQKLLESLRNKENITSSQISNEIKGKKPSYDKLNEDIIQLEEKLKKLNIKITKYSNYKDKQDKILNKKKLLKDNIEEKLELYNKGYCPYCDSELKGDEFNSKKNEIEKLFNTENQDIIQIQEILDKIETELVKLTNKKSTIYKRQIEFKEQKSLLIKELKFLKNKKEEIENKPDNVNLDEIVQKFEDLKERSYNLSNKIKNLKIQSQTYLKLKDILDESNIRKRIIKQSIIPINNYIKKYSEELNFSFIVQLGDNFDALINNNIVDSETISTGEDKIINVVIALSYLSSILDKQHSNILFIDELFNSIDVDNINLILKLLKTISRQYNLNIIIVHHYLDMMDRELFDKIIQFNKPKFGFSEMKIIKNV